MSIEKALSKFREDRKKLMLSNERLFELYEESQGKIEVNPLKICDIEYEGYCVAYLGYMVKLKRDRITNKLTYEVTSL